MALMMKPRLLLFYLCVTRQLLSLPQLFLVVILMSHYRKATARVFFRSVMANCGVIKDLIIAELLFKIFID